METIARTPLQLGNSIRERRRKLGLSQEQLATKVGVRPRTVSDIESAGAGRLDTLLRALGAIDLELVIRPRTKGSLEAPDPSAIQTNHERKMTICSFMLEEDAFLSL